MRDCILGPPDVLTDTIEYQVVIPDITHQLNQIEPLAKIIDSLKSGKINIFFAYSCAFHLVSSIPASLFTYRAATNNKSARRFR